MNNLFELFSHEFFVRNVKKSLLKGPSKNLVEKEVKRKEGSITTETEASRVKSLSECICILIYNRM